MKTFPLLVLSLFAIPVFCYSAPPNPGVEPEAEDDSPLPRKLLAMAKQPAVLSNADPSVEQFRLIYQPSFQVPFIVHVTKSTKEISLKSVLFTGAKSGRVAAARNRTLSAREWEKLTELASAANLWTMPIEDRLNVGSDGSTWILEATKGGSYYVVSRWSPTFKTAERKLDQFVLLGQYLAALSPHKFGIE
jgi:hypothetical protein